MTDMENNSLRAIAEEAANWFITFEENDVPAVERDAFVEWLKRSPTHVEEFMRVSATHAQIKGIPAAELPNVKGLLEQAQSNVIDLTRAEVTYTENALVDAD